jgi:Ca2+-binding EF-hand superfamily protein
MADDKKEKKSKKKKEAAADEAPAEAPARTESKGSRKAKRTGSNVFSMFSQKQVQEFKEGFSVMDADKDGILSKNDLRATFDQIGRLSSDKELDEMLKEAPGALNFTTLLSMFAERMAGGSDDDDIVQKAFKTFDENGKIDSEKFRTTLMTFGEKFTADEVDDAFEQMEIDGQGKIDTQRLIAMLTSSPAEEEGADAA